MRSRVPYQPVPPRATTPTPLCQATPRWQELTPQLQASLLVQLTRLLQPLVAHVALRGSEVDDDGH